MSQQNVETIWRAVDAFNRRDLEAFADLCVREVEIVPLRAAMEGTVYRGHDAVARFFAESDEAWEELRIDVLETRDLGDRVLAFVTLHARGRASGALVDQRGLGLLFHFRDGLITAAHTYLSREEALEAAGLSE